MVTENRETSQHKVEDANIQPHAAQEHTVICCQRRGVEQGLEHSEGQSWERACDGRRQNVTWEEIKNCFIPTINVSTTTQMPRCPQNMGRISCLCGVKLHTKLHSQITLSGIIEIQPFFFFFHKQFELRLCKQNSTVHLKVCFQE